MKVAECQKEPAILYLVHPKYMRRYLKLLAQQQAVLSPEAQMTLIDSGWKFVEALIKSAALPSFSTTEIPPRKGAMSTTWRFDESAKFVLIS